MKNGKPEKLTSTPRPTDSHTPKLFTEEMLLYLNADLKRPLIIPCSGFTGLQHIHPERFARYLTRKGCLCFSFDYRGFGKSEGIRRRVILEEQVRDVLHAVGYVETDSRVDPDRVVLLGWGMGAGVVLDAARELMGVIGLILVNGFYSGKRVQQLHQTTTGFLEFREVVRREYSARVRNGHAGSDDPFKYYPLDDQSRKYVEKVLRAQPGYDVEEYSAELADSLLRWFPEAHAKYMWTPLLLVHGTRNALHPASEAESLFAAYGVQNSSTGLKESAIRNGCLTTIRISRCSERELCNGWTIC